ncbi:MAG: hypothetical protein MJE77_15490 [Proteobacteria bacterium]|nr:hypothetical protein [Pseudomonadota bacterium]
MATTLRRCATWQTIDRSSTVTDNSSWSTAVSGDRLIEQYYPGAELAAEAVFPRPGYIEAGVPVLLQLKRDSDLIEELGGNLAPPVLTIGSDERAFIHSWSSWVGNCPFSPGETDRVAAPASLGCP